ncbi:MAG: ArnT family glycosyltransferase [Gaiellaceae bacterium]
MSIAARAFSAAALVLLALSIVVAVSLPYGDWDAMSFGTWSRLIAAHWPNFHFALASAVDYQRPLFFVLQGFAWRVVGFHQSVGRLVSLAFSVLFVVSVAWLASRTASGYRRFVAALAVVVVLTIWYFDRYIAAGLTDIPVAAMIALTAVLLCARRLGRAQLPLVGLAAALSVLTKPSALPALLGLGAAVLIGHRSDLRRRAFALAAIGLGTAAGLLYDLSQAHYVHMGLRSFLTVGTTGFYAQLADQDRKRVLLDGAWLGPDLRIFLWFALVYAIVRLARVPHRLAVLVALPVAAAWSWLGPHLSGAHGVRVGILGTGGTTEQIAVLVLAASLLFAVESPAEVVPGRLRLARLLAWALPTLVLWGTTGVYDTRLLAPAWPPLVLLVVWTLLPAFAGAQQRSEWLVAIPAAAVLALVVLAAYNINGLEASGWRQFRSGGLSGLTNAALMRNVALGGDFSAEINAIEPQLGPRDRILTYDGRLEYFYLDQIDLQAPESCNQLAGHRLFVLLEDDEVRKIYGRRADSAFWEACRNVSLTKVDERPGAFAVFVNGPPRAANGGCGATPPTDQGLAIEFGRVKTQAQANALQKQVAGAGFVEAKVEQLGCSLYRVVETGVPSQAVGQSIVAEAKSAKITAVLVSH